MHADDIRFLLAYDRWATRKILRAASRLRKRDWPAGEPIGKRHLGEILVHQLGAHQRWRLGLGGDDEAASAARPERQPLPSPRALQAAWAVEWDALDAWLDTLDDAWLARVDRNVPFWQMLAHVVNHGTQHRSEAAVLLTAAGRSPGDLDMIFYAVEIARAPA
jgi:uncharacterized damage-inducible protein DinB